MKLPNTSEGNQQSGYQLGEWRVYPEAGLLVKDQHHVHAEPKLMDVLSCLMHANGQVVSRDELINCVWPRVVVNEEVLTRAISELRTLLGDISRERRYIATIPKRGYKLLIDAEPLPGKANPMSTEKVQQPLGISVSNARPMAWIAGLSSAKRTLHGSIVVMGYAFASLLVFALWSNLYQEPETSRQVSGGETRGAVFNELDNLLSTIGFSDSVSSAAQTPPRRILVTPLTTISNDAATRTFAAGLSADLQHALSQQAMLNVVYQRSDETNDADLVLSGTVQVHEKQARVNLQIIEKSSARLLWSRSFETQLTNTLDAQASIARLMNDELHLSLTV